MKPSRMDVETLSKAELLMLLSILEGELEAQDLVIHTLKAQQRDVFVQERYGRYDLSDPFMALQRDSEAMQDHGQGQTQARGHGGRGQVNPSPLAVLKLVMSHCKHMQEKMMAQLAAAESRHRRVIADLEEEKRRHAQDTAEGDDVTYMLEKERERLLQQLEMERARAERLERECHSLSAQVEENQAQQQQLSSNLAKECQRASAQAQEESERVAQLCRQLEQERSATQSLQGDLEQEKTRALQTEARVERQLAEFDTEREQMRAKLRKEESHSRQLQELIEHLKKELEDVKEKEKGWREKVEEEKKAAEKLPKAVSASAACQTEPDGKAVSTEKSQRLRLNGHQLRKESESSEEKSTENGGVDNGGPLSSPVHALQSLSPSSTACSSLSSSPCSSPVLAKRLASLGTCSPTYPSSYQSSVNQRFHAARHKFQQQAEQGGAMPLSPRELSPTSTPVPPLSENSTAKQMARNTVTQVLSRFTSQQAASKAPTPNSSPFGTDYRTLATASSPTSKGSCPLSPGIRSPTIPRGERSFASPVAQKKPGTNPGSPVSASSPRSSHFPELSNSCGISSTQEGAKELDLLMSKSS
ncbi:CTTNBP2 N-terminal like b isoform X2 [Ictalurus furcatus]|uniref:CTTNBP2 N-terminal like b isoform X2 n=1 Tax=Ictalurus furcatus TaxID=66913 RepID=UPI00234FE7DF|nr:CTTNBP2 N-terminal like b isoform X2 [Ictalurus furcatus]